MKTRKSMGTLGLLVRNGLAKGQFFPLEEKTGACVLGREAGCGILLFDAGISRRHARIERKDGRWTLRDLDSRNGTFLNSLPVREAALAPKDLIQLGPIELLVAWARASADPDREHETDAGELGTHYLPLQTARGIVGASAAVSRMVEEIHRVGPLATNVLIHGETGTGKELVARAIHAASPRRDGPFVAVNCGALPENLVESELFGHEKGAFTGAASQRIGYVEEASGGTLFLDEIGDLPGAAQAKLLRLVENRVFRRVGGTGEARADLRFIAATHRDLNVAVRDRQFREDLYHRLRVMEIRVPPLRERREDLRALAEHFLFETCLEMGRHPPRITEEAIRFLESHSWPGNVRELKNAIERAMILVKSDRITPEEFNLAAPASEPGRKGSSVVRPLAEVEKEMIRRALAAAKGNKAKAAALLKIGRTTFYRKLEEYGLT